MSAGRQQAFDNNLELLKLKLEESDSSKTLALDMAEMDRKSTADYHKAVADLIQAHAGGLSVEEANLQLAPDYFGTSRTARGVLQTADFEIQKELQKRMGKQGLSMTKMKEAKLNPNSAIGREVSNIKKTVGANLLNEYREENNPLAEAWMAIQDYNRMKAAAKAANGR